MHASRLTVADVLRILTEETELYEAKAEKSFRLANWESAELAEAAAEARAAAALRSVLDRFNSI